MAEDMEQVTERLRLAYEAFNRADFDEAVRYLHPNVEWHRVAEVEPPLHGREAVRATLDPEVWGKQQIELHGFEVFGDSVVADTTFHGAGIGSGIEVDNHGYQLWRAREGMGVYFKFFSDRDEAVAAAKEQTSPQ